MEIKAGIVSESNGKPIAGAQVLYQNDNGDWVVLTRADDNGLFAASVPNTSPNIMVVAPGYAARIIDAGEVADQMKVELKETALANPSLVNIDRNITPSSVPTWVWLAGGVGLFYLVAQPGGGGRVSGETKTDYSKYILPAGLVIGGIFLIKKLLDILPGGAGTGTGANNQAVTDSIATSTKKTLADLAAKGITPTITTAQAASIANNIFFSGLNTSDSSGAATIFNLINQARNDADIYLIIQQFGARKVASSGDWTNLCSTLNISCDAVDLDTFVTSILNNWNYPGFTVSDLNYELSDAGYAINRGITYQF
jgi:hypothetical protein